MSRLRLLLFGFTLSALPANSLFPQAAPTEGPSAPFTLTLNVRTAVEDVVVMNKNGRAVPGLRKEDFQVFENGKPQVVSFFEPNFAATEATAPPSALPLNTFTNIPVAAPNNVTNVLLLDALNTWPEDRMYAHVQMVKYLASLPPNLRIGIFTLTYERLNLIQGFNQDSSALRAAIAKFASKRSPASSLSKPAEQQALVATVDEIKQTAQEIKDARLAESADALQHFLKEGVGIVDEHDNLVTTLNALQALAHYLAGIPGRKNLFWLVGDFPLCLLNRCPYVDFYRETKDMLAEAGVSVYPIDAGGVAVGAGELLGVGGPPAISARFINTETWAEETGGKAFHANDIKQEIADAVDHGSRYYTLTYAPSDRKEAGRERKVEVKVLSGNYTLFYRKRYFEQTQKEITTARAQPEAGTPRDGGNAQLSGKVTRYRVGFQLQASGLSLLPDADGARRKSLEVALVVFSQDGKPLNWENRNIRLLIKPEQWAMEQSAGIPFHLEIDAPPGDVYLRTGVYDSSSSKMGTLEIPLSALPPAQK